jgi:hypothetical protein
MRGTYNIRPGPVIASLAALFLGGCGGQTVFTESGVFVIPSPPYEAVESVLFLLGDAGEARSQTSPLLERMRRDVEVWSERLEGDSSVAVLILGDNVYPRGLNPPGSSSYDNDTSIVMGQVRVVNGPWATARGTRAYFMAGNHDWGLREDWEGYVRLVELDNFLKAVRSTTGAAVEFVPTAGTGGPEVIDWGDRHRLVILETAWWLVERSSGAHQEVLREVEEAFSTAGDREIIIAAHHPFKSGGPHGGRFSFWETLGVRYVLFRSGAVLQDISSRPYRDLDIGLRAIFNEHGPPLAFIGGHEHSLQIIEGTEPMDPIYNIISGSGSKMSSVGPVDGLVFAQGAPGYMRLVIEKDGGVSVFVEATEPRYQHCPGGEPARTTCMEEGIAAFRTVFSKQLK